ncbi:MAG: GAF domain-containing sensor histidine kinase [Acidimicrobiales bacterium]
MARLVVGATAGDACFVHVVDHDAGEVVLMGATPDEFDALAGSIRLPLGDGIAGWVAQHATSAVVPDKWSDDRYRYIPALRGEDFASLLSVPMMRPPSTVVGVLNVHAEDLTRFGDDTLARLQEVASLVAGVVEGAVLHDRLARREADLEVFAARTIELQELDRRRIAGDIHDGISQRLVSAWYHLRAAISLANDPEVDRELASTAALLSEALEDSRRAITGLRPALLDDLGLPAAITSVASGIGDLDVTVDVDACDLAPHVETALFRIAQETLQNVMQHAEASRVQISLALDHDDVVFAVTDDGVGFDQSAGRRSTSFGLDGMHERAGLLGATLKVRSAPGQGTSIVVRIPAARARTVIDPATAGPRAWV